MTTATTRSISYHCRECGEESPDGNNICHPAAVVDSIASHRMPPLCACGEWSGIACRAHDAVVLVDFMPLDLQVSHESAGNAGSYPHNGAVRVLVSEACAKVMVESDCWVSIISQRGVAS